MHRDGGRDVREPEHREPSRPASTVDHLGASSAGAILPPARWPGSTARSTQQACHQVTR
jgi:hypothetical protein